MRERPHLRLVPESVSRPDLRHARRSGVVVYRVRVDIDDARPPIWRRLDLRSDLTLDLLHQVLQVAFDWTEGGGIPLTAAGYLKPADVTEASKIVPAMNDWIGKSNREINCFPLLQFREAMQSMGLLRKNKGTLLLTKAGEAARRDNGKLVAHLASRLIPTSGEEFDVHTALLLLTYAAASPGVHVPFDRITALLAALGWRYPDGGVPNASVLYQSTAWAVLRNVTDEPVTWRQGNVASPAAAALARRALGARN